MFRNIDELGGFCEYERDTLIIGPSNSGKTSLVAAMQLSSSREVMNRRRFAVEIMPLNRPMQDVSDQAWSAIQYGRLPINATSLTTEYVFEFRRRNRGLFAKIFAGNKQVNRFCVTDGPGGELLPNGANDFDSHSRIRDFLLGKARDSSSLVLCVDSADDKRTVDFVKGLPKFFFELGNHRFQSVIFLLTKADACFHQYGKKALKMARKTDPWPTVTRILTSAGVGSFLTYCDHQSTEFVAGWCSAYGFAPKTGEANFNPQNDCMATFSGREWSISQVSKFWCPFGVTDFLTYLSVGEIGTLWPLDWEHLARTKTRNKHVG